MSWDQNLLALAILFTPAAFAFIVGGAVWWLASAGRSAADAAAKFKVFGWLIAPAATLFVAAVSVLATPEADRAALFGTVQIEMKHAAAAVFLGVVFATAAISVAQRQLNKAPEERAFLVSEWREAPSLLLIAPIGEELIFRGYGAYALSGLALWQGALITSIAFALMHFRPTLIAASFVFGMAAFALDRWSGTLAAPIIAHFTANLIVWLWMRRVIQVTD